MLLCKGAAEKNALYIIVFFIQAHSYRLSFDLLTTTTSSMHDVPATAYPWRTTHMPKGNIVSRFMCGVGDIGVIIRWPYHTAD